MGTAIVRGGILRIKQATSIDPIYHQQFVDDTNILTKASIVQARMIKEILSMYESATGQKVNFSKNKVFFLNTPQRMQNWIAKIF